MKRARLAAIPQRRLDSSWALRVYFLILPVLPSACLDSGADAEADAATDAEVVAVANAVAQAAAVPLYGQHFPHGHNAVDYMYGPLGLWRDASGVYYSWNYYKHCETPGHAYDLQALILNLATTNGTAPDAHCILFGDANHDGEITDDLVAGYAFHEHAGRGTNGEQIAPPFYQFWFDDNWLARYMTRAYDRAAPIGLYDHDSPVRWRLLDGDNNHWTPYPPSQHIDQLALNGMFKVNRGDFGGALADWHAIKDLSGWTYNSANQRYEYSLPLDATYYLGLWAILSERLLATDGTFRERDDVLQHAMSLRSNLLSLQERNAAGNRLGWKTGIHDALSLINTETTSISVLALGANATWVLEPGYAPLQSAVGNYSLRPHNVLSAVTGVSTPGYIVFGPGWNLRPGTYDVDFTLRTGSTAAGTALATMDVYDGDRVVAEAVVDDASLPTRNQWRRYRLTVNISNPANATEFRVHWHGNLDLDVGPVRVTQR